MLVSIPCDICRKTGELRVLLAQSRTKAIVDLAGLSGQLISIHLCFCRIFITCNNFFLLSAVQPELWKQLMHRPLGRTSLCLNNSLSIVLAHLTILVAMAVCHHRLLNMSSTTGVWILKRLIHTQERMVNVNSQLRMLVFKSMALSISPS